MTNEQHIENLKKLKSFHNGSYGASIDVAIKALEQEPCEDVISRQATIEAFQMFREYESNRNHKEWVDLIEIVLNRLPPVKPQEPMTGYWIVHEIESTLKWLECSNCHCETSYKVMYNYCPYCSAKMEVSE